MKKLISVLLVLVLCFSLMSALAYADKIDQTVDTIEGVVDSIEQATERIDLSKFENFKLPNVFTQLFNALKLDSVWGFIRNVLAAVRGIDANI